MSSCVFSASGFRSVHARLLLHRNVQRFRGGLVFKAYRRCVSLNSRLKSNALKTADDLASRPQGLLWFWHKYANESRKRLTLNPKPQTPNPKPQTPNPKPQTPNPKLQTLNPQPQTPTPQPKTVNPKPETRNHNSKPQIITPRSSSFKVVLTTHFVMFAGLMGDAEVCTKVDVRLPGKGNSKSHGARPVHLTIMMIKSIRTSRLSIKNSLYGVRRGRCRARRGQLNTC